MHSLDKTSYRRCFLMKIRRLTVLVPGLVIVIVPVLVSILVIVLVTALVTVGCRTLFLSQNCYGHDYSL